MKGRIRLIITVESETQDDRDGGQGWQRIRRWRRGEIETAETEMQQIGDMMGTTKEIQDDEHERG